MISHYLDDQVSHTQFQDIAQFLNSGDVLVINGSKTMNAALPATRSGGTPLELHLSTRLPANLWSVEVRKVVGKDSEPLLDMQSGERLSLPNGATVTLHTPHNSLQRGEEAAHVRLWIATLQLPEPLHAYLAQHGFPIRYAYVQEKWPIEYYQTVYATETGSAEMPSAGRAFSAELITKLVAKGVQIVPLILHTGVASLEEHEPPYEEFYRVSRETAVAINNARKSGKRVIAVGTTVIRALETVTDDHGITSPGEGWTDVIITPKRGIRAVDGLLTGLHEPRATHLAMLETLTGIEHLCHTYSQALEKEYLWHEFGDLHLILP